MKRQIKLFFGTEILSSSASSSTYPQSFVIWSYIITNKTYQQIEERRILEGGERQEKIFIETLVELYYSTASCTNWIISGVWREKDEHLLYYSLGFNSCIWELNDNEEWATKKTLCAKLEIKKSEMFWKRDNKKKKVFCPRY